MRSSLNFSDWSDSQRRSGRFNSICAWPFGRWACPATVAIVFAASAAVAWTATRNDRSRLRDGGSLDAHESVRASGLPIPGPRLKNGHSAPEDAADGSATRPAIGGDTPKRVIGSPVRSVRLLPSPSPSLKIGDSLLAAGYSSVAVYRVTAYCPCVKCCGVWSAHRTTASGRSVTYNGGRFVAADRSVPFGTMLSIPGYNDGKPVPVEDRGGAIKAGRLDVYFPTHKAALAWGVRDIDVTTQTATAEYSAASKESPISK